MTPDDDPGGYDLLSRHPLYFQSVSGLERGLNADHLFSRLQQTFPDFPASLINKSLSLAALVMENSSYG